MSKILIVDDSDVVAEMLTQILTEKGYEIIRAKNGVEGIEKVYSIIPDLIIMDVEMPLMQGYQASRLLKSRRGVKDIPIIMHTSLSEDKDKYWAASSGADIFITKDFDNIDLLSSEVEKNINKIKLDINLIREDAKNISHDKIFEMIGTTFDRELFKSTILNLLGDIGKKAVTSIYDTVASILELLTKVCESNISIIMFEYKKKANAYILTDENVYKKDIDAFLSVCINDFYTHFPDLNLNNVQKTFCGKERKNVLYKERLDNKKISSYSYHKLLGKGGEVVATLHLGNFSNNYFSGIILDNINTFVNGASLVIENAMLFKEVNEMKDKIRHVFSKFVPDEIITDLIEKDTDKDLMIGEKRNIVVLFSDIRSFTTITENNSAEDVVSFLNSYFDIQVEIIKMHGGNIDKFIGDAIFAIFGAPVSYEDNAERAINAAIGMIKALDEIDVSYLKMPTEKLGIGIGLHEGDAIVGNIGASTKFDYTAIGDTINLAARLESLTKHYKRQILVSEELQKKISDKILLREIDYVKVKGKDIATSMFAVEFDKRILTEDYLNNYKKALKLYKMGNFSTALEYYSELNKKNSNDYIVSMYIKRCKEFLEKPPKNWDGSIALDFK